MNKRHYEHTLPNIRGSLSNTYIIYGISRITDVNINKYAEYRCDAYAVKYGCGEGLLSFLRRLKRTENVYGEHPTFTEYIMSTHPSTEKRIARLEKLL